MTARATSLAQHPIHARLLDWRDRLTRLRVPEREAAFRDSVNRFGVVSQLVIESIKGLDADLVSFPLLAKMDAQITAIVAELTALEANPGESVRLDTIHNHCDALIDVVSRVGTMRLEPQILAVAQVAAQMRSALTDVRAESERALKVLEDRAGVVSTAFESTDSLAREIRDQVESQKGRLDGAIAEFQRQFSEAEDRRRQGAEAAAKEQEHEYQRVREAMNSAQQEMWASQASQNESNHARFREQADSVIAELEERKRKAAEIVGIVSNIGVTGHYDEEAARERGQANLFRAIALIMMCLIVVGVGMTLFTAVSGGSWQEVVLRIGTTIALAIPAGYAAREAEHHRVLERHYRRMELELASIDSYLAGLPEERRMALKADLTSRFFGRDPVEPRSKPDDKVSLTALDIIRTTIENLTKR